MFVGFKVAVDRCYSSFQFYSSDYSSPVLVFSPVHSSTIVSLHHSSTTFLTGYSVVHTRPLCLYSSVKLIHLSTVQTVPVLQSILVQHCTPLQGLKFLQTTLQSRIHFSPDHTCQSGPHFGPEHNSAVQSALSFLEPLKLWKVFESIEIFVPFWSTTYQY